MSKHRRLVCLSAPALALAWFIALGEAAVAEEKEPVAIFELGAAGEWGLNSVGGSSFGATGAVEFTAIKNWLAIEAGATGLFRHGQNEWDTDIVFKKPFELSPSVEFEPGIGPVWIHTIGAGSQRRYRS